jgi:hypothetical protein
MESERLGGQRLLNEEFGTVVYQSDPPPLFAGISMSGVVGKHIDQVLGTLKAAAAVKQDRGEPDRTSFHLFSASFFVPEADSRLLMLMMAVETLLDQQLRSPDAQRLLDELAELAELSGLDQRELASVTVD